LFAAIHLTAAR